MQTNSEESKFIAVLGIDIMKIAEQNLITRSDYIAQHTGAQTFKIIQDYKEKCSQWQQKGDLETLCNEKERLYNLAIENGKNTDLATNVCFAIAENCWKNQITRILHSIVHAPSLEKARVELLNLEVQAIDQAKKNNMTLTAEMNKWIIDQYGFDILDAAQNCYQSRADYVNKPENNSLCTDPLTAIVSNIENKNLPTAHAELIHCETQVDTILEEQNITDSVAQKEYIKQSYGKDVVAVVSKAYTDRPDHKKLVEFFIPIDVEKSIVTILENNNTYEIVADEIAHVADCVIANAKHASLDFITEIEPDIYDFIDKLKITNKAEEFIVDVSIVDHLLTDIQYTTQSIVDGKRTVWERCPELFVRGLTKFVEGLYLTTQIANMGDSLYHLGLLLKQGGQGTVDALCDPITTTRDAAIATFQLVTLANAASNFVSDLTYGRLYLPAKEYKKRTDFFCGMVEHSARMLNENVTAEQSVDFFAQAAADLVFPWLALKGFRLLKGIDALGKLSKPAAAVTRVFKKAANTHLADSPVLATTEGIIVRIPGAKIIESMEVTNTSTKNVVLKVEKTVENIGTTAKMRGKQGSPYQKISKSTNTRPLDRLKGKDLIGIENVSVSGYESLPKRITLNNYEHYLQPELRTTTSGKLKPSGWHHDPGKNIERIKRINGYIIEIEKYEKHSSGIYKFRWGVEGMEKKPSTFFPHAWSRETVQQKIVEAYKYARKNHCIPEPQKNGSFAINGFTKESIKIKIIINREGMVVTAYPVWPE